MGRDHNQVGWGPCPVDVWSKRCSDSGSSGRKAEKQDLLGIVREDKEDNVAGGMGREEEEMSLESPGDGLCMPLWFQSPPHPHPAPSSGSPWSGTVSFRGSLDIPWSPSQSRPSESPLSFPFYLTSSTLTPALPVLESRMKEISKKADLS